MNRIKRQNKLMIIGAIIFLGALILWSLGFEIYARNAEKEGIIDEDIELVTLSLENTQVFIDKSVGDNASYNLARSGKLEWKMYGKELRITARGGILDLKLPGNLQSLVIANKDASTSVFSLHVGELRVTTDEDLMLSNMEAERSKLDVGSLDMTSSEIDTLLVTSSGKVEITDTDSASIALFFQNLDATILGGKIGIVDAASNEGCLEIEPENGISSITVTGGASTIFIDGDDISSQSYQDEENPDGAQIEFTSPKGSVKTC